MDDSKGKTDRSIFATGLLSTAILLCLSTPSTAQDNSFKFEITPFAAYRVGGNLDEENGDGRVDLNDSSAQGIIFNIKANPNGQYDLLYARQSTDANTTGLPAQTQKVTSQPRWVGVCS